MIAQTITLGGLLRVSSTAQADNLSLPQQQELVLRACEKRGYGCKIFNEQAVSALATRRPVLEALVSAIESGDLQGLALAEVSRFLRPKSVTDALVFDRLAQARALVLVTGRWGTEATLYDLANPDHYEALLDQVFTAGKEGRKIRDRFLSARAIVEDQGGYLGGRLPFWLAQRYLNREERRTAPDDTRRRGWVLELIPEQAALVRRIVELYLLHSSVARVARILNREGAPSPLGGAWRASVIGQILRNPRLAGLEQARRTSNRSLWGQYTTKAPGELKPSQICPPVIDADTWQTVRARLTSQTSHGRTQHDRWPLTGILRCAGCGSGMLSAYKVKGGKIYTYYSCRQSRLEEQGQNSSCKAKQHIPTAVAHWVALEALHRLTEEMARARALEDDHPPDDPRAPLFAALAELDRREERLLAAIEEGLVEMTKLKARSAEIKAEREKLRAQLAAIDAQQLPPIALLPESVQEVALDDLEGLRQLYSTFFESLTLRRVGLGKYEPESITLIGGRKWL